MSSRRMLMPKPPAQDLEERQAFSATSLKIDLNGDRRLTEKVILEVQAAARRLGIEIANVEVIGKPATRPKIQKPASRHKPRPRA